MVDSTSAVVVEGVGVLSFEIVVVEKARELAMLEGVEPG